MPNVAAQSKAERETGGLATIVNSNNAHSQIPLRRFPSLSSHSYDNHAAANANNESNVTVSPQERRKASQRLSMDSKRNIDLNMSMNMDVNMEIPQAGAESWADPDTGRTVDSVRTVDNGRTVDAGKIGGRSRRGSLRSGAMNLVSSGKKKDGLRNESPNLIERKDRIDVLDQDQDQERSISSVVQKSTTVSDTRGPESPELRDDSMLHRHIYDGEVWVARLDEGLHNQQQSLNTQTLAVGNKMNTVGVSSSSSSGVRGSMKKTNVMSATSSLSGRRSMKKWRRRGYGRGCDVDGATDGGSASRIGDDGSSASAHSVMRVGNGQYRGSVVQRLKARATELAHGGSATVNRMGVSADRHLQQQQQRQHGGGSVNVDDGDEVDLVRLRNELEPYGTQRLVPRDTELSAAHSEWYVRGHGSSANDTGSERDAERRRWSRWKRRDDGGVNSDNDAMTAEKVGPKMSFASVGERIFSTFKM